jgi:hypothetical protein
MELDLVRFRRTNLLLLRHMWIVDLKLIQQYHGAWVILRGGCASAGQVKRRKVKT